MNGTRRSEDLGAIRARSLELARNRLGLVFKRQGGSWKALCPFHRETTPSFDYREDTRTFRCFGCGWAGGDIFALYTAMHSGTTFPAAVAVLGMTTAGRSPAGAPRTFEDRDQGAKAGPTTPRPVAPADATEPIRHPRCVGRWRYTDAEGRTLGYQDRINDDAGKRFTSWRWNARGAAWEPRAVEKPRPLYGVADLYQAPHAPVLVCEGEKAADAAREAFPRLVCVTSMGGSGAPRSTDWTPLRRRDVRLWPDNDAAGYRYACHVAAILAAIGTTLLVVRPSLSMPGGWDLADPLPNGTSPEDLHRLLSEARSLEGKRS